MKKTLTFILFLVLLSSLSTAATLEGSIYNSDFDLEKDVIVEINTKPLQKYLSKDGTYSFELPPGKYIITVRSNEYTVKEEVEIDTSEGKFIFDLFLLPDFVEEDELWQETEQKLEVDTEKRSKFIYIVAGIIFLFTIYRVIKARKKYGPLKIFRKRIHEESKKSLEEHKQELSEEPGYLEKTLEIIKKHDGRISQKELRKEMLYLSEAKVSLIITELEHKEKIEKIKKGRGNVIIIK